MVVILITWKEEIINMPQNELETFEKELEDGDEGSPIPNPGSPEAQEDGCCCSVTDNNYGRGRPGLVGAEFIYNEECPIHGELGII